MVVDMSRKVLDFMAILVDDFRLWTLIGMYELGYVEDFSVVPDARGNLLCSWHISEW